MDSNAIRCGRVEVAPAPLAATPCTSTRDAPAPPTGGGRTSRERSDPAEGLGWLHLLGPGTLLAAPHLRFGLLGQALASCDRTPPRP